MKKKEDALLFNETVNPGYSYYQNGNILSGLRPSPHGSFKLRFNSIAKAASDSTGEIPSGNSFPAGSILVKEVYSGGDVSLYVVRKKIRQIETPEKGGFGQSLKKKGPLNLV